MTDIWFGPDVGSDLIPLVAQPDAWTSARQSCAALQLYHQHVLADVDGQLEVGPNCYPNLVAADFFRKAAALGLPLTMEAGAVKPWSCDGIEAAKGLLAAIGRVHDAGGEISAIALDEPLMSRVDCHLEHAALAEPVAHVVRQCRQAGIAQVGLVEAYPASSPTDILDLIERLEDLDAAPSFLHLDIDPFAFKDRGMSTRRIREELRALQGHCRGTRTPLGVIVIGQRPQPRDQAHYHTTALDWCHQIPIYFEGWPDRLIVQSWLRRNADDTGPRDFPMNLPESDASSHTALVRDVAAFARTFDWNTVKGLL